MNNRTAGHTAGPWHVEGCEECPERGRIYIHARGWLDPNELIGEAVKTDRDVNDETVAEAEANARLMAAAPDLLAALRAASEIVNDRAAGGRSIVHFSVAIKAKKMIDDALCLAKHGAP